MTEIEITYVGELSTRCVHSENNAEVLTDAPKDNSGLGRVFSPTDLLAASLGSCMLTLMGIGAKKLHVDIRGMQAKVSKEMTATPVRRVAKLRVEITCQQLFSDEVVAQLVQMAESCPVKQSLHPDIIVECTYQWGVF